MTTTTNPVKADRAGRVEGAIEVLILITVAGMAGAASFHHVHDWTMHNSPPGTGSWFGWANAMVSELIPLAAGLEARRRHRLFGTAGKYPIFLILAAVALSLTGQFGEAKHSISGWVISAVPALGFLALVKLILSRPVAPTVVLVDEHTTTGPIAESTVDSPISTPVATQPTTPIRPVEPVVVPAHLVPTARFAVTNHAQTHGQPITRDELAVRMSVTPAVAGELLTLFDITEPPTRVNGTHVNPVLAGDAR